MRLECPPQVGSFHIDTAAAGSGHVRYRTTDNEWSLAIFGPKDERQVPVGLFYNLTRIGTESGMAGSEVYPVDTPIERIVESAEVELALRIAGAMR